MIAAQTQLQPTCLWRGDEQRVFGSRLSGKQIRRPRIKHWAVTECIHTGKEIFLNGHPKNI